MKTKFYLSSLVLLFFSLLAGGSVDNAGTFFLIIFIIICVGVVALLIKISIENENKEKRLKMIKEEEQNPSDFDRSVSIGDDRCKLYFDASKKRVMIMRVMTEGITKEYVDNFEFSGESLSKYENRIFNVYDAANRKLLTGTYENSSIFYDVTDIGKLDKNIGVTTKDPIPPFFSSISYNFNYSSVFKISVLIDEHHGLMAITEKGKLRNSFNYIKANYLPEKTGLASKISVTNIGNYMFIMDNFFKVLVLVGKEFHKIMNYSDIIEVSYEENGNQLFTKSTGRTVGGAVVGGTLMGGAGAVVGGLSGDTKQNREIKNMDIKILLRSTKQTSCILHFMDTSYLLNTKNESERKQYEKFLENANQAKDLLSIIIDDAKQVMPRIASIVKQPIAQKTSSVADELSKLAKLKADGILTEEEFQVQKAKLLR